MQLRLAFHRQGRQVRVGYEIGADGGLDIAGPDGVIRRGVIRDQPLGQTYLVVRRTDGRIVRRWVAPDSPLVYQIDWTFVLAWFNVPAEVVGAIPMDDQWTAPNQLVRRFDGGDDRSFSFDAGLGQWRHVPDPATFQALDFYWCDVTASNAASFARIPIGPPRFPSAVPARGDYPNCGV